MITKITTRPSVAPIAIFSWMQSIALAVLLSCGLAVHAADDAYEPNNVVGDAKALSVGSTNSLIANDDDWFSIQVTSPGVLHVNLTHASVVGAELNMVLWNSSSQIIATNWVSNGPEDIAYHVVLPGTYYVEVREIGVFDATYTLVVDRTVVTTGDDGSENNDSVATPTVVSANSLTSSLVAKDEDWFRIDVTRGPLTVAAEFSNTDPDLSLELYDASYNRLSHNLAGGGTRTSTGRSLSYDVPSAQTLYAVVFASSGAYAFRSTQTQYPVPGSDDAYESNNSKGAAATLAYGTYSSLVSLSNEDWYKLADAKPGMLRVRLDQAAYGITGAELNCTLEDGSGSIIGSNLQANAAEEFMVHIAVRGDYFIRVYPATGGNPYDYGYTLAVGDAYAYASDDAAEDDDRREQAYDLGTGTATGPDRKSYDDDWHKLKVHPGVLTLNLEFNPAQGDVQLEVYDTNYVRQYHALNSSGQVAGGRTLSFEVTTTTDYYITAFGRDGVQYRLTADSATIWMATFDAYGPVRSVPTVVYDLDSDGTKEILVGTSKALDAQLNEVRPAALLCLNADGTLRWAKILPGLTGADPHTGKTYTSSSIGGRPAVTDIDGDGNLDIVVGVGGDVEGEAGETVIGQPGDKGGVYALNASDGSIKWFKQSEDIIGGTSNTGDGVPDGVFSSPVVVDFDGDGTMDIVWGGWDQNIYAVHGSDGSALAGFTPALGAGGSAKPGIPMLDTVWATPAIADVNDDGNADILIGADITENTDAQTQTGGIFHVISQNGQQNVPGFDSAIGNANYVTLKGRFEEQTLWSSPEVADLDGDGKPEILYGTGNFFKDSRGKYIRVLRSDGTVYATLATQGRTYATPLVADLDGDGYPEVIACTVGDNQATNASGALSGYVHCWSQTGAVKWTTLATSFSGTANEPIFGSPLAVDLDGDGKLEVVFAQGAQLVVIGNDGVQMSSTSRRDMVFEFYKGSAAIDDIDADGRLDIICAGTNAAKNRAAVYRWRYGTSTTNGTNYRYARRQFAESSRPVIESWVRRFYTIALNRAADAGGLADWTRQLMNGTRGGGSVATGILFSQEFKNRNLTNAQFLNTLYQVMFNRAADTGGYNDWIAKLDAGMLREDVVNGFIYAREFSAQSERYRVPSYNGGSYRNNRVRQFVNRFYNELLGRYGDESGVADWTQQLVNGTATGKSIAEGFANSAEYQNKGTTDSQYIDHLYRTLFGRDADAGGKSYWLGQISGGASRATVLNGFIYGTEFSNLCSQYGIVAYPSSG
jgi:hypothetical protein